MLEDLGEQGYRLHPVDRSLGRPKADPRVIWTQIEHRVFLWDTPSDPSRLQRQLNPSPADVSIVPLADRFEQTRVYDCFGRVFAPTLVDEGLLADNIEAYNNMAEFFGGTRPSDDLGPFQSTPEEEGSGMEYLLGWQLNTTENGNLEAVWNSESRLQAERRPNGLGPSVDWTVVREPQVTVSSRTTSAYPHPGGSGILIGSDRVLTAAHVIGSELDGNFVPNTGPWMVCGWGSKNWCSTVLSFAVHPDYLQRPNGKRDLAVLRLGAHPGYSYNCTVSPCMDPTDPGYYDSLGFALLSTASDSAIAIASLSSLGYPADRPTNQGLPVVNMEWLTEGQQGRFVRVGDGWFEDGFSSHKQVLRALYYRMDAAAGQSGSGVVTVNPFGIPVVEGLVTSLFFPVVGTRGVRGPKIPHYRDWIITTSGSL